MKLLLDTQLLLWSAITPDRLSPALMSLLSDLSHELLFSAASIWEVVIKAAYKRPDFDVDPTMLRRGLLDSHYRELPITSGHTLTLVGLPPLHKDPFDRLLIAQAISEGVLLLTADPQVAKYSGPIRLV
jgi:PIN domain nuclease of toxin-antitoxin system